MKAFRKIIIDWLLVISTFYGFLLVPVAAEDWIYEVRSGDNLWSLSTEYLINPLNWKRLKILNQIDDPRHLVPGTKLRIPAILLYKHPIMARVLNVNGGVFVKEEGQSKDKLVSRRKLLIAGDSIRTETDANITIEFVDGSIILLQPNSQITLNILSLYGSTGITETRVQLDYGRMETKVVPTNDPASRFEISTPAAVTSVRGTDYRVSAENEIKESRVETLSGQIKVKSADHSMLIGEGYGTIAAANTPPLPPIPLLEPPDTTSIPRTLESVPIEFVLPVGPEIQGRRIQIAADQSFDEVLYDGLFTTDIIRGPDLPDGHYHLRVRNIDAQKLEGLNSQLRITLNARPEAPFLTFPDSDAGVILERPVFKWSRQAKGQKYHFQIAQNIDFLNPMIDIPKHPDVKLKVEEELGLGIYYWRVAVVDENEGHGPFSNTEQFRRITPPPTTDEPEIDDKSINIRWKKGLTGQKYQIQMAEDVTFERLIFDQQTAKPQVKIPRPEAGDYFVRVRNIDPDGYIGPFNKPQILIVPEEDLYWWLLMILPLLGLIAL